jgi:hypothetical protein
MLCLVKNSLMKRMCEMESCRDAIARFCRQVRGEVFAHFYAVAVKPRSSMRN